MTTKEEYENERIEEEYREQHEKDILILFKGSIYITALDEEEAIEKLMNRDDIEEYIDESRTDISNYQSDEEINNLISKTILSMHLTTEEEKIILRFEKLLRMGLK